MPMKACLSKKDHNMQINITIKQPDQRVDYVSVLVEMNGEDTLFSNANSHLEGVDEAFRIIKAYLADEIPVKPINN